MDNKLKDGNDVDWNSVNKKVKKFSLEDEVRLAKCVHVYDGDTVQVVFPLQGILYRWSCRLSGVDTPELRTRNKNEKKYGYEVRDALREKILNKMIELHCGEFDKYGRLLAKIYINQDDTVSVNKMMVENGHGYPYHGGNKKKAKAKAKTKAKN